MRILALRGENLASLESFDIDFAAEPLESAGLFAITGPTGAGKSTLLDAMSLALFDTVPRLEVASKVQVGRTDATISQDDVRSLLRHGATTAFAECDFLARDGHRYRARWHVARARTGTLKQREMSLTNLDTGEGGSGKLTEIKAQIAAIIGLSAAQFGRAVVLAQGDFEAFIKAGPDERSELLEKLTGTEIYTKIGRLAGAKANALRQEERDYLQQLKSKEVLGEDQRGELEKAHNDALDTLRERQKTIAHLEKSQAWEARACDLRAKCDDAEKARDKAFRVHGDAAPRRERLERHRKSAKLIPAWRAMTTAQHHASEATRRSAEAEAAVPIARQTLSNRETEQKEAARILAEAEQAMGGARPALTEARALDTQIKDAGKRFSALMAERDALAASAPKLLAAKDRAGADLIKAEGAIAQHDQWLTEHEPLRFIAQKESELLSDLAALDTKARAIETARRDQSAQLSRMDEVVRGDEQARSRRDQAAQRYNDAKTALETRTAAMPSADAAQEAQHRRDGLLALENMVAEAGQVHESRAAQAAVVASISGRHAETETALSEAVRAQSELSESLPILEAEAKGARRVADRIVAAESDDAKRLRASLVPREPCPVCGSSDHALTLFEDAPAAPVREAAKAAQEAEQQWNDAQLKLHAIGERVRSLTLRRDELAGEVEAADAQLAVLDKALADADQARDKAAHGAGLDPESTDFAAKLDEARAAAQSLCSEQERLRAERDEAQTVLNHARTAFDEARAAADLAAEAKAKLTSASEEAGREIERQVADRKSLLTALNRQLANLPGAGGDWQSLPDKASWLSGLAATWRDHDDARSATQAALPELRQMREAAAADHDRNVERLRQVEQQCFGENERHGQLRGARAKLLNGEEVNAVEDRLSSAIKAAAAARDAAHEAYSAAQKAWAEATTADAAAKAESERLNELSADANNAFAKELTASGLDVEMVASAAAQTEDFEAEEARLQAMHDALTQARSTLDQRQADLDTHIAAGAPGPVGEELADALTLARPALGQAEEAVQDLRSRLDYDDRQRAATADLRAEIEAWKARSAVWLALGDMIGDSEGKKFRKFAQSLTLDRLLEAANARLSELKPRYVLERASGGDMAIQVIDNDMAGEVRGLHNLSGGERFLVSLALALGLAEMSTGRGIRIESLFIDEGFGALDPASLGQALAVLEHLHATGRRVGVISHVEEMKERIPVKIEVTPVSRGRSEVAINVG